MASNVFNSDTLGAVSDDVVLTLGIQQLVVAEAYSFKTGIFEQPSSFSLTIGHGSILPRDLIAMATPNALCTLSIGGVLQATGAVDGHVCSGDSTTVSIRGRDVLACLHDSFIEVEEGFSSHSYFEFTQKALSRVGFTGTLLSNNRANRQARAGVLITVTDEPDSSSVEIDPNESNGDDFRQLQSKVKERWTHLVKREHDRGGLFLWASGDGNAVLSRPNPDQAPIYRIVRDRAKQRANARLVSFRNETTNRFSVVQVVGRYGGKKNGPAKAKGAYVDQEMVDYGYDRPFVAHDVHCSNQQQAEFFASRKLAESRRQGWELTYQVAGHSAPSLFGGGRTVWTPDTMVDVDDEELGLKGAYYLEAVEFARNPETTTTLTLMRPEDLLFGLTE